jgi:hypothetical protein
MITKEIVRKSLENKKQWVGEIYFDNKPYPNIISGRYASEKTLRIALYNYVNSGEIPWGEVK